MGDKTYKSAQFVLITAILFIFLRSATVDNEQLEEVVDPADRKEQDQAAESLACDISRVIQYVDGQNGDRETQEAVTFEHLKEHEDDENCNNCLSHAQPGNILDLILLSKLVRVVVKELLHLLLLLIVLVITFLLLP